MAFGKIECGIVFHSGLFSLCFFLFLLLCLPEARCRLFLSPRRSEGEVGSVAVQGAEAGRRTGDQSQASTHEGTSCCLRGRE